MSSSLQFYDSGSGDRFLDRALFNREIERYLSGEERVVDAYVPKGGLLIEVGCMDGRYLPWSIRTRRSYIGLDLIARYVQKGTQTVRDRRLPPDLYRFRHCDAHHIAEMIDRDVPPEVRNKAFLVFPFNSFGNMEAPEEVISNVARCNISLLISSYRTTRLATDCRYQYYERCGYTNLSLSARTGGICLSAAGGLESMAFYPAYLDQLLSREGFRVRVLPFSAIGIAYLGLTSSFDKM